MEDSTHHEPGGTQQWRPVQPDQADSGRYLEPGPTTGDHKRGNVVRRDSTISGATEIQSLSAPDNCLPCGISCDDWNLWRSFLHCNLSHAGSRGKNGPGSNTSPDSDHDPSARLCAGNCRNHSWSRGSIRVIALHAEPAVWRYNH